MWKLQLYRFNTIISTQALVNPTKNSTWADVKASCLSRLDSMKSVRDVDDMYELDIYLVLYFTYLSVWSSKEEAYCELTRLTLWTLTNHFSITSHQNFIKTLTRQVHTAISIFVSHLLRRNVRILLASDSLIVSMLATWRRLDRFPFFFLFAF